MAQDKEVDYRGIQRLITPQDFQRFRARKYFPLTGAKPKQRGQQTFNRAQALEIAAAAELAPTIGDAKLMRKVLLKLVPKLVDPYLHGSASYNYAIVNPANGAVQEITGTGAAGSIEDIFNSVRDKRSGWGPKPPEREPIAGHVVLVNLVEIRARVDRAFEAFNEDTAA